MGKRAHVLIILNMSPSTSHFSYFCDVSLVFALTLCFVFRPAKGFMIIALQHCYLFVENLISRLFNYKSFLSQISWPIFFIRQFFRKKQYFPRNPWKTVFVSTFDDCLRKGDVLSPKLTWLFLSQMKYRIFYCLAVFSKHDCIYRENGKNPFRGPKSHLKRRVRLATKINITSLWRMKSWIFFHLTIFSKKATFLENMVKKMLGTWPFFRKKDHLVLKTNITFFIRN